MHFRNPMQCRNHNKFKYENSVLETILTNIHIWEPYYFDITLDICTTSLGACSELII